MSTDQAGRREVLRLPFLFSFPLARRRQGYRTCTPYRRYTNNQVRAKKDKKIDNPKKSRSRTLFHSLSRLPPVSFFFSFFLFFMFVVLCL